MHDAIVDRKGRILVPEEVRAKLDVRPKTRLKVRTRGREIVLSADVDLTAAQGSEDRTVSVDVVKAYAGAGYRKY
ncbi:MAG: AbrB/MazE/SpoVT family DNA-binding domain-containing protein [Nitrososphaerota archaeon]|jgi:AbrB family looped-hinge helix DNA binding protein|nr:AbrB/MazE/SpoVT family DNA-binding domain-containing protein [Nitrososphaerota archaeon]MDG7017241.1 AbrB/MazE/SpoVT family DNA-binding domain-containing protein [Nitrososphaerota archaeon]MDG7019423.1 AbrB/MazE/SpoVT family DNA-binding domain-containing protein [Nitrososphaerota archaeon]MDG7029748.1 AbrB/MazE/SpoVT family DNA-binding domain-containing protein [Nitrososphaerota archaeon]